MELQTVLLALTAFALALFMVRLVRTPPRQVLDWWLAFAIVSSLTTLGWIYAPANAGFIAFGSLAALIFAPMRLDRAAQRASRAGADGRAMILARLAAILHPLGPIGARPSTFTALARIRKTGKVDDDTLASLGAGQDPIVAEWYRLLALHAAADHEAVRAALSVPSRRARMLQHGLGAIFVRTIAMTGDHTEVLEAIAEAERFDVTLDDPERRAILALEACAALGDVDGVREIAEGLSGRVPRGTIERAVAAAQIESGDIVGARNTVQRALAAPIDEAVRRGIERLPLRSKREPRNPIVEARAREVLDRMRREAKAARALAPLADSTVFNAWATWALAAAIVGWFLVIAANGSTTVEADLKRFGGLVLPIEQNYRGALQIFTSTFVHYGAMHLLFNVYALLTFGRFVESFYGRTRMIVIWIAATLTSGIGVAVMNTGDHTLVGASGAIFGLGGALVSGVGLRSDLRSSRRGREELRSFAMLVALQIVFDRVIPGVSGTAHICGLVGGIIAGAVVLPRAARR